MRQTDVLMHIDANGPTPLRDQICEQLSLQILRGQLRAGQRLPSCRRLSASLGVGKNTVISAYNLLVQDALVTTSERSGYFVAEDITKRFEGEDSDRNSRPGLFDKYVLPVRPSASPIIVRPSNWQDLPYPFVCNQLDRNEFPLPSWRKCGYEALGWSLSSVATSDHMYGDYHVLVEQLLARALPQRGIQATPDELLIVAGAQHAIYITAELLSRSGRKIAMEDPGYPDARNIFAHLFGNVVSIPVDQDGLMVDRIPNNVSAIYVTPNQQFPLGVSMSQERRQHLLDKAQKNDIAIIEDDYDAAIDLTARPQPALFSHAGQANVIYVGSLSKSISPGVRLGFLIGPREFIREARALRGMMVRHSPPLLQIMTAQFLKLGHYDSRLQKLRSLYQARLKVLDQALQQHLPSAIRWAQGTGSTALIQLPGINTEEIESAAAGQGVAIDALRPCYFETKRPPDLLRLGVSAIATDRIDRGVRAIAELAARLRA